MERLHSFVDAALERIYDRVAYDERPSHAEAIKRLNDAAALVIGLRETLRQTEDT